MKTLARLLLLTGLWYLTFFTEINLTWGSELPDAPTAKVTGVVVNPELVLTQPVRIHRFHDRRAWRDRAAWFAVGGFDMGQTCYVLAHGGHEDWMPSQSCAGILLLATACVTGVELLSYGLHRAGHHKLEGWPRRVGALFNVAGVVTSHQKGAW